MQSLIGYILAPVQMLCYSLVGALTNLLSRYLYLNCWWFLWIRQHAWHVFQVTARSSNETQNNHTQQIWCCCPIGRCSIRRTILQNIPADWWTWIWACKILKISLLSGQTAWNKLIHWSIIVCNFSIFFPKVLLFRSFIIFRSHHSWHLGEGQHSQWSSHKRIE